MFINIPKPEDLLPKPVSAGVYQANVTGTNVKQTQKGDPMISVEYTITSQGADPEEKTIGRKVFDNLIINEQSLWKIAIVVKALTGQDLPTGQMSVDEFINLITSAIQGKSCLIRVDTETYEGVVRNRVREVKRLG